MAQVTRSSVTNNGIKVNSWVYLFYQATPSNISLQEDVIKWAKTIRMDKTKSTELNDTPRFTEDASGTMTINEKSLNDILAGEPTKNIAAMIKFGKQQLAYENRPRGRRTNPYSANPDREAELMEEMARKEAEMKAEMARKEAEMARKEAEMKAEMAKKDAELNEKDAQYATKAQEANAFQSELQTRTLEIARLSDANNALENENTRLAAEMVELMAQLQLQRQDKPVEPAGQGPVPSDGISLDPTGQEPIETGIVSKAIDAEQPFRFTGGEMLLNRVVSGGKKLSHRVSSGGKKLFRRVASGGRKIFGRIISGAEKLANLLENRNTVGQKFRRNIVEQNEAVSKRRRIHEDQEAPTRRRRRNAAEEDESTAKRQRTHQP